MGCKGICHKFKASWIAHQYRYVNGQKRCNTCELFVMWAGNRCPCCSHVLRTRPRISKYRQKYLLKNKEISA